MTKATRKVANTGTARKSDKLSKPGVRKTRKGSTQPKEEAFAHITLGFGVPATSDPHHFKVTIPKANSGKVLIAECLGIQAHSDEVAVIDRLLLERTRWTSIRSEVQRAFNVRLKEHQLKTSAWSVGDNLVDRLLGKELCVLAWAVEGMAIENIPVAVRNWLAMHPEERWWLFGMAALGTGGIGDGDKGWRLALRHALGDVAQTDTLVMPRILKKKMGAKDQVSLDLFKDS